MNEAVIYTSVIFKKVLDSDDDPDEEDNNPLIAIANTTVPTPNSQLKFEKVHVHN